MRLTQPHRGKRRSLRSLPVTAHAPTWGGRVTLLPQTCDELIATHRHSRQSLTAMGIAGYRFRSLYPAPHLMRRDALDALFVSPLWGERDLGGANF